MSAAAITQIAFSLLTLLCVGLWYFPFRWLITEKPEQARVNIAIEIALSIERTAIAAMQLLFLAFPTFTFFAFQHHILPTFIVAGHIGIWIASFPALIVAAWYQYHMFKYWRTLHNRGIQNSTSILLADLRRRYANATALEAENAELRQQITTIAEDANAKIAKLADELQALQGKHVSTLTKLQAALQTLQEQPKKAQIDRTREDLKDYVRVSEIVEKQLLIKDNAPVNMAHARRHLTKDKEWVIQSKGGGALYVRIGNLLRNGYKIAANPVAKTLRYRKNSESKTFEPLEAETQENKALSRFSAFAKRHNPLSQHKETPQPLAG